MKEERKRMNALRGRGVYDASRHPLCEGWGGEFGSGSSTLEGIDVEVEVEATGALEMSIVGENENLVRKVKDIGWFGEYGAVWRQLGGEIRRFIEGGRWYALFVFSGGCSAGSATGVIATSKESLDLDLNSHEIDFQEPLQTIGCKYFGVFDH